jgi:hypothetical protein
LRAARFLPFTLTRERFRLTIDEQGLEERQDLKALPGGPAQVPSVQLSEKSKAEQADHNQIDGDDNIEQSRNNQNKYAGDKSNDGLQMCDTDCHSDPLLLTNKPRRGRGFPAPFGGACMS